MSGESVRSKDLRSKHPYDSTGQLLYCTVATHSVCRKEVCVAITASSDYYSVSREALKLTGNKILGDDTTSTTVNDNYVLHLVTSVEQYAACAYLL